MNDDDLRRGFAKLREADARRAPKFGEMQRPRRRTSPLAVIVPLGGALAAAAAVVLWLRVQSEAAAPTAASPVVVAAPAIVPAPAMAAPTAPLDFLLVRGSFAGVPDFDRSLLPGKQR